jgi:hypothetical protein
MKKPRHNPQPTPRQRNFQDEFKIGDRVSVTRTSRGWFDGSVEGVITQMGGGGAVVREDDGSEHIINHPRDINKISTPNKSWHNKGGKPKK